jgi:hypothetical protein
MASSASSYVDAPREFPRKNHGGGSLDTQTFELIVR